MARVFKPSDPLLIGVFSSHGGLLKGVRRSGAVIERRGKGHALSDTVKWGWTLTQIRAHWEAEVYAGKFPRGSYVHTTPEGHTHGEVLPVVTEAQARKRAAAKARRFEKAEAIERERQLRAGEARAQLAAECAEGWLTADPLRVAALAEVVRYACGRACGQCATCGTGGHSWNRGAIFLNRFICSECIAGREADADPQGLPYDGRMIALTFEARPECESTLHAMRVLG